MPDGNHRNDKPSVVDLTDDAIVANANAVGVQGCQ